MLQMVLIVTVLPKTQTNLVWWHHYCLCNVCWFCGSGYMLEWDIYGFCLMCTRCNLFFKQMLVSEPRSGTTVMYPCQKMYFLAQPPQHSLAVTQNPAAGTYLWNGLVQVIKVFMYCILYLSLCFLGGNVLHKCKGYRTLTLFRWQTIFQIKIIG